MHQEIRFATAADGARIAYALSGSGPPLVKAAHWLSHLEYDLESPVWRHWLRELSRDHTLVRYDERGCGLSDWDVADHSHEAWVRDLEAVVDAAGLDTFPLLGISQGGPVAIAYAARHPERVTRLILYGTYARGWARRGASEAELAEREALITLSEHGWGRDIPAYREAFTRTFIPDASEEQRAWFNELQRITCSPANAVRLQRAMGAIDVAPLLPSITMPALVLHARGDLRCPFDEARRLAADLPGARFVSLDGRNHLLLEHEPAWDVFLREVRAFLGVEHVPVAVRAREAAAPARVDDRPLLQALREKKVAQWTIAYLTAAFGAVQLLGAVQQPWGLTDLLMRASQVVLAAGAALVAVLAWYHGDRGRQRVGAVEIVLIALVLAATGAALLALVR